jgi:hypothetical protein
MKRTYISPEFRYDSVFGTLNMEEEPSFFGSKMLEIEDKISITNDNLIYYQMDTGEQLDEKTEKTFSEIIYDAGLDKFNNQVLKIDENQSQTEKLGKAKWILTINLKSILINYLYATLKKYRTFEGVRNDMVVTNNVSKSIYTYIDNNIYYRYKFVKMDLYLLPIDITFGDNLQYTNQFDQYIEDDLTKINRFQTILSDDESSIQALFTQTENAQEYCFKYYYNLYFEKL